MQQCIEEKKCCFVFVLQIVVNQNSYVMLYEGFVLDGNNNNEFTHSTMVDGLLIQMMSNGYDIQLGGKNPPPPSLSTFTSQLK